MSDYIEWSKWVKLPEIDKIPFSKYLELILKVEDYAFDNYAFDGVKFELLAYSYGLQLPNRKARKTSIRNWFLDNIDDLTHDDRDALDIMRESKSETLIRALKAQRNGYL